MTTPAERKGFSASPSEVIYAADEDRYPPRSAPLTMEMVCQHLSEQVPGFVTILAEARSQSINVLLYDVQRGDVTLASAIEDLARWISQQRAAL